MPLYCYENSSELEVPLKRSWRLQGLWTILENRCHLLLSRSTGGHWILNKLPTVRAFGWSKDCPKWEECYIKEGYRRAETQMPTGVGRCRRRKWARPA